MNGQKFGLEGFGTGVGSANKPALVKAAPQRNDFGEPRITPHSNPFPQKELARVGKRGAGEKCKTSSRGKRA